MKVKSASVRPVSAATLFTPMNLGTLALLLSITSTPESTSKHPSARASVILIFCHPFLSPALGPVSLSVNELNFSHARPRLLEF